jgi:hypothetical protein
MILRLLCPRDYYEQVTLQAGLEANGRYLYLQVNGLPGSNIKWLLIALGNVSEQKQPCRNVQVRAGEGLLRG